MAVRVEGVKGNVRRDAELKARFEALSGQGRVERLSLSRLEASKSRLRRSTDKGREVIVDVPRGTALRPGDVLWIDEGEGAMIVVEWLPEEVVAARVRSVATPCREAVESAAWLGYIAGMRHWQLAVEGGEIIIPVETSAEAVKKALSAVPGVELRVERRVVEPLEEAMWAGHTH